MPYSLVTTDLTGKTALITASTSGIGFEMAQSLAKLGATVILHGRNPGRAEEAQEQLIQKVGLKAIEVELADLESQRQIRDLAERVLNRHPSIDILINNAGAIYHTRQLTEEGIERTLAVSHLASVLLTTLLLPAITQSSHARIVNVSAAAAHFGRVNWGDLNGEKNWAPFRALGTAKLLNLAWHEGLARQLSPQGVTVNSVDPLGAETELGKSTAFPWIIRAVRPLMIRQTAAQAAWSSVWLAASPEIEGITGELFNHHGKKIRMPSPARNSEFQDRVMEMSRRLLGLSQ